MKPSALFSVITVSKQNLEGLKRTHHSLESQSFRDFEWLVIDGASTDGTQDFLKTTTAKWSSEKDDGPFDAMNVGIKHARGDYLLFLNAGDVLAKPETLEKIAKIITEKQPDFIYGDSLETGNNAQPFYKAAGRYKDLPKGMFTHHQAMFYRLKNIRENDLWYSVIYEIASDYEFTAKFLKNAKKIIYAPLPVCVFQSGGLSQKRARTGRREEFMIRDSMKMTGMAENVTIFALQTLAWNARRWFPGLYEKAKKPKDPQNSSGQSLEESHKNNG